jgi:hypothetical protein
LGLTLVLAASCETPPGNAARYWEGRAVQAPAIDAAGPSDPNAADPFEDPVAGRGGSGGFVAAPQGGGGAGGSAGSGAGGIGGSATGGNAGAAGMGGAPSDAGSASDTTGPVGAGTGCMMTVKITTVTTGIDYAPDNIGAVWIADAGGKFVKSLEVWANRRMSHLNKWVAATSAAGRTRETVDAVTAATIGRHTTHTSTWNCTGAARAPVPRGSYQLCMEMNESNDQSIAYQCVKFDNAGVAFKLMPPDAPYFKARVIDYVPR